MRDKCNECRFSAQVNIGEDREMIRACIYILHRLEARPCKAGAECTVFEPGNPGRRGALLW